MSYMVHQRQYVKARGMADYIYCLFHEPTDFYNTY
jgi:hypothetical protein